jgi:GT2 family glycosyltransferase
MTPDGGRRVAIVMLTWNGREDTLASLASVARVEYEPLVTVVVDNGSTDGTAAAIRERFPRVELVVHERNLGFPGGVNSGIARARELGAEHFVLLNNDTEVEPGFVEPLVEAAARGPVAAVCSKVYFMEPRDAIWFAGASYDPRRGYQGRPWHYGERDPDGAAGPVETERICGASVLIAGAALDELGAFDERFFFYTEDVDWSLRARERGWRLLVEPRSRVWHRVSAVSGGEGSPVPIYYNLRNSLAVVERHAPLGPVGTWRRRAVLVATHALLAARRSWRREGLRAVRDAWRDFRAGRFGERAAS